jgi:zinc D-Ala-D-Ala carboxypeptidase
MTPSSPHFSVSELSCRCGCGRNNVKQALLDKLETARTMLGRPIALTSAARCPAHELFVAGKSSGAHVDGDAVDIACESDRDRLELLRIFIELGVRRFGISRSFLHVDISETLPQSVCWTYRG